MILDPRSPVNSLLDLPDPAFVLWAAIIYVQRPRRAMSPHPNIIDPSENASFVFVAVNISWLNKNSCAISYKHHKIRTVARTSAKIRTSTRPVYIRIPALIESITPLTSDAVALPGLYVVRTPRPAAIPIGVVRPYTSAPAIGTQSYPGGKPRYANREPTPSPSNVSAHRFS